jgi:hypothetical protein
MKYLGFIKEHNNIIEAVFYNELIDGEDYLDQKSLEIVIQYLSNGVIVLGWMNYFVDLKTKDLIAPNSFYTDGEYIWPSYLSYYLKKHPNLKIDKSFLNFILFKSDKIKIKNISAKENAEIEKMLSSKLNNESSI